MQLIRMSRTVLGIGQATLGVIFLVLSPNLTTISAAQVAATVDPEREFTYADNQAVCDLGSAIDSTFSGRFDFYAGAQNTTLLTGGGGLLPATFDAYCVDIASDISRPSESVTVEPLDSSFNLGVASANPSIDLGGALAYIYNNNYQLVDSTTEQGAQFSAALQLSLWTVEYNWTGSGLGGIDPTLQTGNFYYEGCPSSINGTVVTFDPVATAAIRADATEILDAWDGQTTTGTLLSGTRFDNQSLVGPPTSLSSAPEPGSAVLAIGPMIGFIGSVLTRRRRRS